MPPQHFCCTTFKMYVYLGLNSHWEAADYLQITFWRATASAWRDEGGVILSRGNKSHEKTSVFVDVGAFQLLCHCLTAPAHSPNPQKQHTFSFRGRNIKNGSKYVLSRLIFLATDQWTCCRKSKADLIRQEQCRMRIRGQIQLKAIEISYNAHDNTRTWWSRCSVSAYSQGVFSFASICFCFEKITECLTALNIPNSWHVTEMMKRCTSKILHFFPLFCEKVICSTTKER